MTTLYFSPGSCSLVPHIALEELGITFTAQRAPRPGADGHAEYMKNINPTGAVPALVLDDNKIITQNVAIVDYLSGQKAGGNSVLPVQGSYARSQALRWLCFANSDIHPKFGPLFGPSRFVSDEANHADLKANCSKAIMDLFAMVDEQYQQREWIAGEFSAADVYLYVVMRWALMMKFPVENLKAYRGMVDRIQTRDSVKRAMATQGIAAI